jgi:hypothetical protein
MHNFSYPTGIMNTSAKELADALHAATSQHALTSTVGRSSFCIDRECDRVS